MPISKDISHDIVFKKQISEGSRKVSNSNSDHTIVIIYCQRIRLALKEHNAIAFVLTWTAISARYQGQRWPVRRNRLKAFRSVTYNTRFDGGTVCKCCFEYSSTHFSFPRTCQRVPCLHFLAVTTHRSLQFVANRTSCV